jgi:hypothetical protein
MGMTRAALPRLSVRVAMIAVLAGLIAGCGPQNKGTEKLAHEGRNGHEGRHGLRAACADDLQKYCANADKRKRCLRQNIDKLSEPCKTALAERRNKGGKNANADNTNNTNNTTNTTNTNNNKNSNSDDDDN